jgi:triacylglycerol lipase
MPLPPRELPPPRIGMALLPAKYPYDHFLNAELAPFEAKAGGFSRANAWWLAEASLLAYWDKAEVKTRIKKVFGDKPTVQDFSGANIEGYVASFDEFAMVAFRGTESTSLADIVTDIKFAKEEWKPGERVHEGFYRGFVRAWGNALSKIPSDRPVWFTGHSLGAALATLAADTFVTSERAAQYGGVYTFGSPLVGDRAFVDGFNTRHAGKSFRIVNDQDGVPLVPPRFAGYRHVNEEHFVGLGVRDTLGLEAIIDHTPCRYSILCSNAVP